MLATALAQAFPNNHLQASESLWFLAAEGLTAKDVSDKLGIGEGKSTGIVISADYFGELQKAVGGLTQAVDHLSKRSDEQGRKVLHMSQVLYAALTAIGVFVMTKLSYVLVEALKKSIGH